MALPVATLVALVGCTSLLGSFEVSGSGPADGSEAGSEAAAPCKQCGSECVDLTTSSAHCGSCETACSGGQTCQASACTCPKEQAFCGNRCVTADREHCGGTCAACQSDEVCNGACVSAPSPQFEQVPRDPTGWVDEAGKPVGVSVKPTGIPGTIYECRTGPAAKFTPSDPPWKPCDGAAGSGTVHKPAPDAATPEGTYRTEYRYRSGTFRSATISTVYYALHKLDKVPTCPRAGHPEDPKFSDDQYFVAATVFAQANPMLFPIAATFPKPVDDNPQRTDDINLHAPFIKVPFVGIDFSKAMTGEGWPAAGSTYVLNELSLRHKYRLNPARTLLLVRRQYVQPSSNDCTVKFDSVGSPRAYMQFGPEGRGRHKITCEAYVLNSRGNAVCLVRNATGSMPVPLQIDTLPNKAPKFNSGSAVNVMANSKTITATNAQFLAMVDKEYILLPDSPDGYWYKVVAATTNLSATISPPYRGATGSVPAARVTIAESRVFNIPTGYAKLHEDSHNAALGSFTPGYPSFRTKCIAAGCDAAKPWLTYLPP